MIHVCYTVMSGKIEISSHENAVVGIRRTDRPLNTCDSPTDLTDSAARQIMEYLKGERRHLVFPIHFEGTEFQIKVWRALMEIPYGQTQSYRDIAGVCGHVQACRAVGAAIHRNPLILVIPCHRVIGLNGTLMGYSAGTDWKRFLLDLEKKHKDDLWKPGL